MTMPPCLWIEVRWAECAECAVVVGMVEDGIEEDVVGGEVGSEGGEDEGEEEEEEELAGRSLLLSF